MAYFFEVVLQEWKIIAIFVHTFFFRNLYFPQPLYFNHEFKAHFFPYFSLGFPYSD